MSEDNRLKVIIEFEGFESMHVGRPPVGVALIGRSGMRQMRGEELTKEK